MMEISWAEAPFDRFDFGINSHQDLTATDLFPDQSFVSTPALSCFDIANTRRSIF